MLGAELVEQGEVLEVREGAAERSQVMIYELPCGNRVCPICPPQSLRDVPESSVQVITPQHQKAKKPIYKGSKHYDHIGRKRDDWADANWSWW
jgi:hypothetical protein